MAKRIIVITIVVAIVFSSYTLGNSVSFKGNEELSQESISFESSEVVECCKSYIMAYRAYARGEDYTLDKFYSRCDISKTLEYRESEANYRRALADNFDMKIVSDNVALTILNETVENKQATIEIYENYEYIIEDADDTFYRNRVYTFDLIKENNKWVITEIKTNDPWEESGRFDYSPIDVKSTIDSIYKENKEEKGAEARDTDKKAINSKSTNSLYSWTYYPNVAVSYAAAYFNSVNSLFGSASADCQNFASQCVWAGLRGSYSTATSTTTYPAVSSSVVGKSKKYVWARNDYSNAYSTSAFNWSWDNAAGFAKMIEESSASTYGPYGNTYYQSLDYAQKGSVITINWQGSATSASTLDHAMFVTKVKSSATSGSINRSDLYIAAHNSNTQSAYQPLLDYSSYPETYYSTSVIWSGKYPQTQYNN